jgi:gas vesicle protein
LLTIKDINPQTVNNDSYSIRIINEYSIEEFKTSLSYESWDSIFGNNDKVDVDSVFNIFLNNYLRIVYTSFPLRIISERDKRRRWITTGIKTSCNRKRELYLLSKDSKDVNLIKYYKQYCKILACVITEAKRSKYNNQIINSTNKMKTTWNIIKSETNRQKDHTVNIYENSSDAFNDYFSSVVEKIMQSIRQNETESSSDNIKPVQYLSTTFQNPFPDIKFKNTSTKEIE